MGELSLVLLGTIPTNNTTFYNTFIYRRLTVDSTSPYNPLTPADGLELPPLLEPPYNPPTPAEPEDILLPQECK